MGNPELEAMGPDGGCLWEISARLTVQYRGGMVGLKAMQIRNTACV